MTTRVADIITRARDTLADPKKERWSDDRLLRLLDEAQKDFARQTSLLKGYANIPLIPYIATYNLPDDCWRLTRAHYAEQWLQLLSHEAMDERNLAWYTHVASTVGALVFDQRNETAVRCYPIPNDDAVENSYAFGVTTVAYEYAVAGKYGVVTAFGDYQLNSVYGVTTSIFDKDITTEYFDSTFGVVTDVYEDAGSGKYGVVTAFGDYQLNSVYGVTTSIFDKDITTEYFDSAFGVVTDAYESAGNIAIFYIRDPSPIKYLTDELEVSSRWDIALKHYVVGHAFLDDLDSQYQVRGSTSLALYDRELKLAKATSQYDSMRAQLHETSYDGGI